MAIFRRPIEAREWNAVESVIHEKFSDKVDTLCDHVRVIFKIAEKMNDKTIMDECRIVMVYAKRMDNKLKALQNLKEYDI